MMKKIKLKKGFTLAELLIVVAIVGILVAISIPLFSAQTKKAVIAANKANIRAAKAAATAEFYSNPDVLSVHNETTDKNNVVYFIYDVKSGAIETTVKGYSGTYKYQGDVAEFQNKTQTCNAWGRAFSNYAKENKVCDKIIVFIGNKDVESQQFTNNPSSIQTAPYYTERDEVGYTGGNNNPFGPSHGSSTAS